VRSGFASVLIAATYLACGDVPRTEEIAPATDGPGATAPIARLARVEGDVRHSRAPGGAWTDARAGLALHVGDGVQTMEGSSAVIVFLGGGRLAVQARTTVRVSPRPGANARRMEHLAGRLVARLDGDSGDDRRLEVAVPAGALVLERTAEQTEVEARVVVEHARTQIAMLQGDGRLERTRGSALAIESSRYVEIDDDGAVLERGVDGDPPPLEEPADEAVVATRGAVRFSWGAVAEADAYRLILRRDGEESFHYVDEAHAEIELPSGPVQWWVRALRGEEACPSSERRRLTVALDRRPPALRLLRPRPGLAVRGRAVRVAGQTEPGARVEVNGNPVDVAHDGTFWADQPVPTGLTNIVVRSRDPLGNQRVATRSVLRER